MKLDSFDGKGFNFFEGYSIWITMIESLYHVPESKDFQKRKFRKVNFSEVKDRRFFTILKILAEKGPCTATELGEYSTAQNQLAVADKNADNYFDLLNGTKDKNKENYFELLNGRKGKNVSLVERGVVISSKSLSDNKKDKKFALTYFGIFYAIKLFFGSNVYEYYYPAYKRNYDFSEQKNTKTIIDLLAENYSWALPLIFDKWKDLKQNKYINAHFLAELAIDKYFISDMPLDIFDEHSDDEFGEDEIMHNSTHPFADNSFADEITARFYFEQKRLFEFGYIKDISKLIKDKKVICFLKKVLVKYNNYIKDQKMYLNMYQLQFKKRK